MRPSRLFCFACAAIVAASAPGCLDWNSSSRHATHSDADAGNDSGADTGADSASAQGTAGDAAVDEAADAATDADSDSQTVLQEPDAESAVADAGTEDAALVATGACPSSACPAVFPCVGTDVAFTCQGQFADFPVPVRDYGNTVVSALKSDKDAGLVYDETTGLEWERVGFTDSASFSDASAYCAGLALGGHRDFRLPWVQELITLYGSVEGPGYDPTVFLTWNTNFYLWTATPSTEEVASHFVHAVGNDYLQTGPGDSGGVSMRCVRTRESRSVGVPAERFVAVDGGTLIRDEVTKLVWEADVPLARAQQSKAQAEAHCSAISTPARMFTLPTTAESLSIVDYSKAASKRLAPGFSTRATGTWTSTHQGDRTGTMFAVLHNDGSVWALDTLDDTDRIGTRCVSRE